MSTTQKEKWTEGLATAERMLDVVESGIRQTHKIDHMTYTERSEIRGKFIAQRIKLKTKISRLTNNLLKLAGPIIHKDIFGQELKVGATIAWSPSGRYAGATVGYVSRSTPKMIQMVNQRKNVGQVGSNIYPQNVIVVDKLIGGTQYAA